MTSDGSSAANSLKNGVKSSSESGDVKRREIVRGKSFEKTRDQDKATPKVGPAELKEASDVLRKQTETTQDGRAGSRGPNALKPGKSIIEQIGEPDHQGWMRKKGDRYNSWKLRFCIIKGPHLYILRSNSMAVSRPGERGALDVLTCCGVGNQDQGVCQHRGVQGRRGREH